MRPRLSVDVLIFSDIRDFHTERIIKALPQDCTTLVLNLDRYGHDFVFLWSSLAGPICVLQSSVETSVEYSLSKVRSVWWRRPFGLVRSPRWPSRTAATNPTLGFLYGIVTCIGTVGLQINDLNSQFAADRKMWQLNVAKSVGFDVPKTLITDQYDEGILFAQCVESCVVKGHSSLIDIDGTQFLQDVQPSLEGHQEGPLIFQEFVRADREHRLIHCGGFIAGGTFEIADFEVSDVRAIPNLRPLRACVPLEIEQRMVAYCRRMNLHYAAFDIRENNGRYTFLEANTCGEWLYVDACNDYRITETLAAHLVNPAH